MAGKENTNVEKTVNKMKEKEMSTKKQKSQDSTVKTDSAEVKKPRTKNIITLIIYEMLYDNKTDKEIWDVLVKKTDIDAKKSGYPGWYRAHLRRQGEKIPTNKEIEAGNLPKTKAKTVKFVVDAVDGNGKDITNKKTAASRRAKKEEAKSPAKSKGKKSEPKKPINQTKTKEELEAVLA